METVAALFSGLGFAIVLIALAIVFVVQGVKIVPQGHAFTVERLGRYTETLMPGLNIIVPFVDRIGARVNMMEKVLEVPTQEVITRDNATVSIDGVAFYQVFDAYAATYEVRSLEFALLNLTMTNIRTVIGAMELDDILSSRDSINDRLLGVVDAASAPWGIKITRIEIKDISPPSDLVDAMARQMKAERDRRAQILEAEGDREAEIQRAEGHKRAAILEAEGRREAAFRDAEAREREAKAEAAATELVSAAIGEGNVASINYFVAQNYVRALEALAKAPNQKILMMPLDTAGVMGTVAGISEIVRDTFAGNGRSADANRHGGMPAGAEGGTGIPRVSMSDKRNDRGERER